MRKGSNFVGTEEELLALMKDSLRHFTSDIEWLSKMDESLPDQEFINICESIAECVDRGYIKDIAYNIFMNKKMMFHPTIIPCTITSVPEGTTEEELKEHYKKYDKEPEPYSLTQAGKDFLDS